MIQHFVPVRRVGGWAETLSTVATSAGQIFVAREQRKALRAGAGAEAVAKMSFQDPVPPPKPSAPAWQMPALIGGGVLALVLLLKR